MLLFNLPRLVQLKGITRPYSYFMKLGYPRSLASKMSQNQMQSLTLKRLEQFCIHFNCTPNDLFEFRPNPTNPLPPQHALNQLIRENNNEEILSLLHDLPVERIRELAALVKNEYGK